MGTESTTRGTILEEELTKAGNAEAGIETPPVEPIPDDEEQVEEPEAEEGGDQDEGFEADAVFEELAEQEGDLSAEDIRRLDPEEAKQYTDEQLLGLWNEAKAAAAVPTVPFPVYDAKGNKIDPAKLSLADLVSGKALIGYNAMQKEQRKALNDVIRAASLGHLNEHRMSTLQQERQQMYERWQQLAKEHDTWGQERATWNAALDRASRGDNKMLQGIIKAYSDALGQPAPQAQPQAQQASLEAAGTRVWYEHVKPAAEQLADRYGAKREEVVNAVRYYIGQTPAPFLTQQKLNDILTVDVPALLMQYGYGERGTGNGNGNGTAPNDQKIAALERQIQELRAGVANEGVAARREKRRAAPPAGGGHTPGSGESMPDFKSREEAMEFLRS